MNDEKFCVEAMPEFTRNLQSDGGYTAEDLSSVKILEYGRRQCDVSLLTGDNSNQLATIR
jgi:hypothetical protein